ncbi:MAG TPA: AI-2E family transporter [Gemmatimonadaceae bacterium]|nr:AI-2E family transporter [Gemmatimonadaceae bacterium]
MTSRIATPHVTPAVDGKPSPGRFRFATILAATVATLALIWLIGRAADLFLLVFIAALFATYLGAATDEITKRLPVSRPFALTLAFIGTFGAIAALAATLIPPVVAEIQALFRVLPSYLETWERGLDRLAANYPTLREVIRPGENSILTQLYQQLEGMVDQIVPRVVSLGHAIVSIVSIFVMGLYLALTPQLYREWMIALFPPVHRDIVREILRDLRSTLRQWIAGQLVAMVILGVLTAMGLWLLNVPYALTFGVFTGAVAIVPFFGTLVSTILPALFVLGGPGFAGLGPGTHAILVILLGVVIHVVEANVVLPIIVQRQVHIPPVLSMMAVLLAGRLLGPAGLIVAVPLLATCMVLVRRILVSRLYEQPGLRRVVRDKPLLLHVPAPDGGVITPAGAPIDVLSVRLPDGAKT